MQDKSDTSENDNCGKLKQVSKQCLLYWQAHRQEYISNIGIQIWESNNTYWEKNSSWKVSKKLLCFLLSPKTWLAFIILHWIES